MLWAGVIVGIPGVLVIERVLFIWAIWVMRGLILLSISVVVVVVSAWELLGDISVGEGIVVRAFETAGLSSSAVILAMRTLRMIKSTTTKVIIAERANFLNQAMGGIVLS